jgi:hypothetical protein
MKKVTLKDVPIKKGIFIIPSLFTCGNMTFGILSVFSSEKDAIIELAKGKRTTDKTRHSGQGIFFTSKAFDDFVIISKGITYAVNQQKNINIKTGKADIKRS